MDLSGSGIRNSVGLAESDCFRKGASQNVRCGAGGGVVRAVSGLAFLATSPVFSFPPRRAAQLVEGIGEKHPQKAAEVSTAGAVFKRFFHSSQGCGSYGIGSCRGRGVEVVVKRTMSGDERAAGGWTRQQK